MPRRRLGVVLLVPDPVAGEVDGLRRALGAEVGRVPPHVTLVPPINVREDDLGAVVALLRSAAAGSAPFEVELGPVVSFAPVSPVAYLAVGGPGLAAIHGLQRRVVTGPLDRPLVHEFVPHVTVCDEGTPEQLAAAVTALGSFRATVGIDHVHLMEEQRGDGGQRVWRPVAGLGLGPPAVVGRGGLELTLAVADRVPFVPGPPRLTVLGWRGADLVGQAAARVRGSKAWLEALEVDEAVQAEGIGTQLLAALAAEAGRRGATRLFARAEPGSRAAAFLAGRGWAPEDPPPLVRDVGPS